MSNRKQEITKNKFLIITCFQYSPSSVTFDNLPVALAPF